MKFLLGRKLGMTRIYDERGQIQPVTVIEAGPCVVTQIKKVDSDGYAAVQLAYGTKKHPTKPLQGHLKKADQTSAARIREITLTDEETANYQVGQSLDVSSFALGDEVLVIGTSKGKGYQGVVKRHGFAGGPGSHGSDFHRAAGAIGGRWPQRVVKGKRMAGHMGSVRVTMKGLTVAHIDPSKNLIAVSGAIPGPKRGLVEIRG